MISYTQAPKDEEGFILSFTLKQEEEYLDFFETYGFVVVKDILTEVEQTEV